MPRVTVLPDKGAEIHELARPLRPASTCSSRRRGGCSRRARRRARAADGHAFLANYAGGWQELFPSCNDPCSVPRRRAAVPRRGRARCRGSVEPLARASGEASSCVCRVRCALTPFALERRMRLERGRPTLTCEERVDEPLGRAAPVRLGAPLRRRPAVPRGRLPAAAPGAHDRHAARGCGRRRRGSRRGQREPWPHALLRDGGRSTCARSRAPRRASHDDLFLTDLEDGTVARREPAARPARSGSSLDHALFRWIVHLAALRRRARAAAGGLVRARHRAVDLARQPRAGRRRRRGDRARRAAHRWRPP